MAEFSHQAAMLHNRSCIDNCHILNHGICIDDRILSYENPLTHMDRRRQSGRWIQDIYQLVSVSDNLFQKGSTQGGTLNRTRTYKSIVIPLLVQTSQILIRSHNRAAPNGFSQLICCIYQDNVLKLTGKQQRIQYGFTVSACS